MKFSYLECVVLTLALAACASNRPDAAGSDTLAASAEPVPVEVVITPVEPGTTVVCANSRVTGSLVPERVCRTRAEIEADLQTLGSGKTYPIRYKTYPIR